MPTFNLLLIFTFETITLEVNSSTYLSCAAIAWCLCTATPENLWGLRQIPQITIQKLILFSNWHEHFQVGLCPSGTQNNRIIQYCTPNIGQPAKLDSELGEDTVLLLEFWPVGKCSTFFLGGNSSGGRGGGGGRWRGRVVVVVFCGGEERVVVVTIVGDEEHGGIKVAPLNLFPSRATFWAAAPVISPAMQYMQIDNLVNSKNTCMKANYPLHLSYLGPKKKKDLTFLETIFF